MPTPLGESAQPRWVAPFWQYHQRRSCVRLRPLKKRRHLDAWLPNLVEPELGPPQPTSLAEIETQAVVSLDHWLEAADGDRCHGVSLRLEGVDPPSLLVLLGRPRPDLKAIEDLLIDLCDHHLGATAPPTARVRLHLLQRDGWALSIADSLGFALVQESGIPTRGIATLEINRHSIDGLNRPGSL